MFSSGSKDACVFIWAGCGDGNKLSWFSHHRKISSSFLFSAPASSRNWNQRAEGMCKNCREEHNGKHFICANSHDVFNDSKERERKLGWRNVWRRRRVNGSLTTNENVRKCSDVGKLLNSRIYDNERASDSITLNLYSYEIIMLRSSTLFIFHIITMNNVCSCLILTWVYESFYTAAAAAAMKISD